MKGISGSWTRATMWRPRSIDPVDLEVRWVPYGRYAATRLHAAISAAKGDEPLTPVTVVVPSNYVGVATRRTVGVRCSGSGLRSRDRHSRRFLPHGVPHGRASRFVSPGRRRPSTRVHARHCCRSSGRSGGEPGDLCSSRRPCCHGVCAGQCLP